MYFIACMYSWVYTCVSDTGGLFCSSSHALALRFDIHACCRFDDLSMTVFSFSFVPAKK